MCCIHLQGAIGINWEKEKCQQCRIIERTVHGNNKDKFQSRKGHEGQEGK
jgi:hypothetical protein